MQFPVPQFTEVEDKIIGPLTLKQFGVIFAAGTVIFLAYSISKSVPILIFFCVLFGLPALGIAFGKINGRPIYNSFGFAVNFILSPKIYVFHKEAYFLPINKQAEDKTKIFKTPQAQTVTDPQLKIKEINKILQQQALAERELLKRK